MWYRTKSQNNFLFMLNPRHVLVAYFFPLEHYANQLPLISQLSHSDIAPFRLICDPWLDIQKASYFLRSSLVDQLYKKGVYFYSFVTKSNQASINIHPNVFNSFYRTITHVHDFSRSKINSFCSTPTSPTHRQLKHYKLQNEQN